MIRVTATASGDQKLDSNSGKQSSGIACLVDCQNEEEVNTYRLFSVQKSKFNKKERTYFLKQASNLMAIESSIKGVGKLIKIYMSKNNNFLIYRQHFLNGKPAPNICDYLTERNKPLDINLIRAIAVDLLRTL